MNAPRLYATFLLWMLSELFEQLPEVGDLDKPEAGVLLRRGAPAVQGRAGGAGRAHRARRAAGAQQGRRRVLRDAEPAGHSRHRARRSSATACSTRCAPSRRATRRRSSRRPARCAPTRGSTSRPPSPSWRSARRWSASSTRRAGPSVTERVFVLPPGSQIGPITPEQRAALIAGLAGRRRLREDASTANRPTRSSRAAPWPAATPAQAMQAPQARRHRRARAGGRRRRRHDGRAEGRAVRQHRPARRQARGPGRDGGVARRCAAWARRSAARSSAACSAACSAAAASAAELQHARLPPRLTSLTEAAHASAEVVAVRPLARSRSLALLAAQLGAVQRPCAGRPGRCATAGSSHRPRRPTASAARPTCGRSTRCATSAHRAAGACTAATAPATLARLKRIVEAMPGARSSKPRTTTCTCSSRTPLDEVRRRRRVLVRPRQPAWCRCARHLLRQVRRRRDPRPGTPSCRARVALRWRAGGAYGLFSAALCGARPGAVAPERPAGPRSARSEHAARPAPESGPMQSPRRTAARTDCGAWRGAACRARHGRGIVAAALSLLLQLPLRNDASRAILVIRCASARLLAVHRRRPHARGPLGAAARRARDAAPARGLAGLGLDVGGHRPGHLVLGLQLGYRTRRPAARPQRHVRSAGAGPARLRHGAAAVASIAGHCRDLLLPCSSAWRSARAEAEQARTRWPPRTSCSCSHRSSSRTCCSTRWPTCAC